MKTMTRVVAVALVAVMMCMMLASCGNTISGKYEAEKEINMVIFKTTVKYSYEFKGKDVTLTTSWTTGSETTSKTQSGTYEINEDKITITWAQDVETGEDGDGTVKSGTYEFSKGDDFIYIDDLKLNKVK